MNIYPWQKQQWQRLLQQTQQSRLPHALLLQGPAGLGKCEFARIFAAHVLCESTSTEQVCGVCRSCQLFKSASHPDYYEVAPAEKSKSIKVDQIRELTQVLSKTAGRNGYQVVLLHPAEWMNRASANALLKTLEEPSGQVLILLVADQVAAIPATILSRCQRIVFSVPLLEQSVAWLTETLSIDRAAASILLKLSDGAPLQARTLGQEKCNELREIVLQMMWRLQQGEVSICEAASQCLKQDLAQVLQLIFMVAMDILRLSSRLPASALNNPDRQQQLQQLREKINVLLLADWLPQILLAKYRAESVAGINIQLLLEGVLLQWQKMGVKHCEAG